MNPSRVGRRGPSRRERVRRSLEGIAVEVAFVAMLTLAGLVLAFVAQAVL